MGFLSEEEEGRLHRIFGAKRSGGKLKIEIGLRELVLRKIRKELGYYGEQIVLSFGQPPAHFENLKNPIYYHTIDCYHVLRAKDYISFKDNFFKTFTTGLSEKSFNVLKEGMKFLCLVEQSEKMFEKDGDTMKYLRGDRVGDDIILVDSSIRKIWKHDYDRSKIEVDYINLYKFLEV